MTALKYIASAVLRRGAQKSLLHRHVDNNVDMSEQGIPGVKCGSRAPRVASRGGQRRGKNDIIVG